MRLTTRLLLFYLGSVAILLAGFSATLYLIAREHLYRQADERLDAALNMLGAAVEVAPDGVEWEPNDRNFRLPPGPEQVAWIVTNGDGQVVARSERPGSDDFLGEVAGQLHGTADAVHRLHLRGEHWQAGQRCFVPSDNTSSAGPGDSREPRHLTLIVTAAMSLEPVRAVLNQLLFVLAAVSLGVLVLGLVAGQFVCWRAIRPVRQMADDARAVDPSDPARRIVTPGSGDELTDLGRAFNGVLDRLHESGERHRRFAGDASHQLRTPLTGLMGQLEIALRRERTPDEYREVLGTAQAKAAHLHRIVEALLFLTRAGSDAGMPERKRFDLAKWLPEHLEQWASHPRYGDINLVGAESPLNARSNSILLGEVVNILLDNACRYSPSGSSITLSLSRSDGTARLEVIDEGQGIGASDLPQVFTPFFRTTSALCVNKQGVGLGLSIAMRLAEALGGKLTVTSQVGKGSRFTVTIPADRE